jgi:polyphosphate kinase 2 (PPK2 family)
MLEKVDLNVELQKEEFKKIAPELALELAELQRKAKELKIPVVVVFEGWDAAGKGTLVNDLILPLDPRGFTVYTTVDANAEEKFKPELWRFWIRTPAAGRIAIFERSWYRKAQKDIAEDSMKSEESKHLLDDILGFERQISDGGTVIVKFFLHISKKEQSKRFKKLESNEATSWRVTKSDWKNHKLYDEYYRRRRDDDRENRYGIRAVDDRRSDRQALRDGEDIHDGH